MRRGRFTEDQIIGVLREHEAGVKTTELCRKHGINDATFYNWKAKYGGMTVSEAAPSRTLEDESRRLKKMLAESRRAGAERSAGKKLTRSAERYAAVEKLMADHGFSERRACALIGVSRAACQYEPLRRRDDDVRERLREIANERRRFGYRRLAILLRCEGKGIDLKKVYRLYREERLTVRKRGGCKRALGTRAPMAIPHELNQRWSLDFVLDLSAYGRRFRMLAVIDDYSRNAWTASSTPRCRVGGSFAS
jgi:putative transposase